MPIQKEDFYFSRYNHPLVIMQVVEAVQQFEAKKRIPDRLKDHSFFGDDDFWDYVGPDDDKTCDICFGLLHTMPFVGSRIRGYFPYMVILDKDTIGGPGPDGDGLEHPHCRHKLKRWKQKNNA